MNITLPELTCFYATKPFYTPNDLSINSETFEVRLRCSFTHKKNTSTYLNVSAHCICNNFASCPNSEEEQRNDDDKSTDRWQTHRQPENSIPSPPHCLLGWRGVGGGDNDHFYHIYPKYLDILTLYYTLLRFEQVNFTIFDVSQLRMSGKLYRSWSDATFCII